MNNEAFFLTRPSLLINQKITVPFFGVVVFGGCKSQWYFFTKNMYHVSGTQMTIVLNGKGLVFGGLTFKNRGHLGSR